VNDLSAALRSGSTLANNELTAPVRALIEVAIVQPTPAGVAPDVEARGRIAALLGLDVYPHVRTSGARWWRRLAPTYTELNFATEEVARYRSRASLSQAVVTRESTDSPTRKFAFRQILLSRLTRRHNGTTIRLRAA
jgi:hypothetical protein